MSALIAEEHVAGVCRPGAGLDTCSFLLLGPGGWICAKSNGNWGLFAMVLERRLDGTIHAMGNNRNGIDSDPDIPPVKFEVVR